MTDILKTDIPILNNELKATYDVSGSEVTGLRGLEYLEGWCHEMAHLMDLGYSAVDAAVIAQNVGEVVDAVDELKTVEARDDNEVNASAIVICALKCVEGYDPMVSVENCYGNVKNRDRVRNEGLIDKAIQDPRILNLGKQLRDFLLDALDEGREHAA